MEKEKIITNLFEEISEKRAEIIDNFLKMFVVSRIDWFKEKPERLKKIKLIEERSNSPINNKWITTYRIEMMRGRYSSKNKTTN